MIKLTEQEKAELRASVGRPEPQTIPGAPTLTITEYFKQLEQFARILPPVRKPVAFDGAAWRL